MTPAEIALGVAIFELFLKYGPSGAVAVIQGLKNQDPTAEDIRALIVKPPEEYLE